MTCIPHAVADCATCGVARVRREHARAYTPPPVRDEDPDTTRARAIARARTERTAAKEKP
jgi:hypothetical protein